MRDIIKNSSSKIIIKDRELSIEGLLSEYSDLLAFLHRDLVLTVLPDDETSLELYISIMSTNSACHFMPAETPIRSIEGFIRHFQPSTIISSYQSVDFDGYAKVFLFKSVSVWRKLVPVALDLDPNLKLLAATSGSMGTPKLVPQTCSNIEINTRQIAKALYLTETDIALASLPLSYTFGMSVVNCQLLTGGTIVAGTRDLIRRPALAALQRHEVNLLFGVPTTVENLLRARFFRSKYCKSNLMLLIAGGGLTSEIREQLAEESLRNNVAIYLMYGQAEATTRISIASPKDFRDRPGSVGKPLDEMKIWIETLPNDIENRNLDGQIVCSGPNVCPDYVNSATDLIKLSPRKKLHTGDLGYIDSDGYLHITGRLKHFAKIRGVSVNLVDLEQQLNTLTQKTIFCADDENRVAIFCLSKDSDFLYRRVEQCMLELNLKDFFINFIDEIPLLTNGKVDYRSLLLLPRT